VHREINDVVILIHRPPQGMALTDVLASVAQSELVLEVIVLSIARATFPLVVAALSLGLCVKSSQ
jgi:hypothetical protein